MAELSTARQGPLGALAAATLSCAAVQLRLVAPQARFVLRCEPDAVVAAGQSFGVTLPVLACCASTAGPRAALWLGPDEWLLVAEPDDARAIGEQLSHALAGLSHSLVDVSHRSAAVAVTGPQVAVLINHGCPLDLSDAAFPVGMCTRTLFAKAEIILWRIAKDVYRVEIERSFATYVWQMLIQSREEFMMP
jgi:sarcosine oxidase subunit gamma